MVEEAGEDVDGMAESTSQLQAKLKALTHGKVDIMLDENTFKNTTQILREMSDAWEDMTDIERAAALELMGGKRQANILASVIKNFDTVEDVIVTSMDSAGSALAENEKYLDSIQGKIDQFKNSVQTLWMNLLDDAAVKSIIDGARVLVEALGSVTSTLGMIPSALAIIASYGFGKQLILWAASAIKVVTADAAVVAAKKAVAKATGTATEAIAKETLKRSQENLVTAQNTAANYKNAASLTAMKGTLVKFLKSPLGIATMAVAAISVVVSVINKVKQAQNEAAESAKTTAEQMREANKSLSDYSKQIVDLRKELDAGNLSEQDAYDKRKQLISIQDELIDKYGKEAKGINLVTGEIQDQISAIDELSRKNAEKWLNDNSKDAGWWIFKGKSPIEKAQKTMESTYDIADAFGVSVLIESFKDTYQGEWREHYTAATKEYQEFIRGLGGDFDREYNIIRFNDATKEEISDYYDQIASWLRQYAKDNQVDLTEYIGKIQTQKTTHIGSDYETQKANYEAYLENTAITSYTKAYSDILDAQDEFYNASTDEDKLSKIQDYNQRVADAFAEAGGIIGTSGELEVDESHASASMQKYFKKMQATFAKEEFELNVKLNNDDITNDLNQLIQDSGLSELDNLAFNDMVSRGLNLNGALDESDRYTQEQINGLSKLQAEADNAGISINELINILTKFGLIQGEPAAVVNSLIATAQTYSKLATITENYSEMLKISNEILHDNVEISEDYYSSLKEQLNDITVAEEGFSDAIAEQNGKYIVKNAALLKQLVKQSQQAKKATIEVARSQAQLQYRSLINQIRNKVIAMGVEYKAHGLISEATLDNIADMREQIDVIKQTIQQYALLEISMSKAASAYGEYEAAKERDAKLSYDESFLEALKYIDEGLLNNETGSETFEYAVRMLVPEDIWAGIEDPTEKVREIHDYLDGDPVFSRLFYVDEESGDLDIAADNVRAFIELSKEAGMILGDGDGFDLNPTVYGTKEWADALGITEAAVLALLSATEDCDAMWGNILTDVMTAPLEREVNKQTDTLDTATKAVEDYWRAVISGEKDFNDEEYAKLQKQIEAVNEELSKANQIADSNAQNWSLCQAALSSYRGELSLSKTEADALARSLGLVDENGQPTISVNDDGTLQLTDGQIDIIIAKLKDLEEPAIMRVQFRYDEISAEIDELKKYIEDGCKGTITIDGVEITNEADAQAKIDELTPEQKEIQFTYGITETSDEQDKAVLESYQELAKNGVEFTVTANVTEAKEGLDSISDAQDEIDPTTEVVVTAYASTAEQALKDVADQLDRLESKTITVTVTKLETTTPSGAVEALGNAFVSGNIGLKQHQNGAVVGELGQEMVVDPIRGTYYTVGDHGTEMVDLPKGAIIYNHKQTEELLKNGRTSRGKMTGGLALAKGNAYASPSYGIPTYHPNLDDKTSFANSTAVNTKWDDATRDLSNAADNISDAADKFEEVFDWIEVRLEEIEEQLNLLNAQLENAVGYIAKNQIIDVILDVNNSKLNNLKKGLAEYERYASALLSKVPSQYRDAAQNGAIAIEEFAGEANEKTLEAIQNYREWAQKAADTKQQIEELKTEISDLAKQKFDNIIGQFENEIGLIEAATDKLDAQISLMEDRGYVASKEYYESMIKNTKQQSVELQKARDLAQAALDEQVKLGNIKVGSDVWYEAVVALYDLDASIVECTSDLESFQNAINDIYWDNFDELIKRYDYLSDETQNLIGLMAKADMVLTPDNEDGWSADEVTWTEEGMASLGLYAQQMEIAEYKAEQYAKAIEDLSKDYKDGKYSESEYLEKLNELKDAQYDAIEGYYDAQDAIKELHEARVDSIKKGIEKEIETYEKLIKKQKEALDSEKDLHDFQKSVAAQQKNIADIERKLAALANDTSISAAAKRKLLEAELAEAQYELEEMYYDRSVEDKQNALDKELESFQKEKEAEIEKLEEYLENVQQVVADSLGLVQANASNIYDTLSVKAEEYNLTLSESITLPWQDGTLAVSDYQDVFGTAISSTTEQLERIKLKWQEVIDVMADVADAEILSQQKANDRYVSATTSTSSTTTSKPSSSSSSTSSSSSSSKQSTPSVGQTVKVKSSATHFSAQSGNAKMASFVPGGSYQVMQVGINGDKSQILIGKNGQYTGWVKLTDLEGYAKGTLGVPEDQFAFLDEIGEELVMHANNGRLSFLTKGTSVIPADLTERLMDLAMNPQSMLDRNRPEISMSPSVTTNNVEITMDIAEVVHIDTVTNDTIPNLTKAIDKQLDKYMKQLNGQIRRYAK